MKSRKDLKLMNIYIKIHEKRALTMDDLAYLAKHNPTCFQKICDNLIVKMPEKKVPARVPAKKIILKNNKKAFEEFEKNYVVVVADEKMRNEKMIKQFITDLKKAEPHMVSSVQSINRIHVRELLGEILNETILIRSSSFQGYFNAVEPKRTSMFNTKV